MNLRPATMADVVALDALVRAAFALYVPRLGREPAPMAADHADLVARGTVTVAADSEELAGMLVLQDEADHLLLDTVAVAPPRQGQGIGRILIAHAEAEARRRGHAEIRLYTNALMTENIATYLRAGYVETGRATQDGFHRVFFAKSLA